MPSATLLRAGGILARPFAACHRLTITRQGHQLGEVTTLSEAGTENDRYYRCCSGFVSFHRPLEFDVVDVVRSEKVGVDQQQDDICCLELPIDGASPFGASADAPVVPGLDQPLPAQDRQLLLELLAEVFVLACVGNEDPGGFCGMSHGTLRRWCIRHCTGKSTGEVCAHTLVPLKAIGRRTRWHLGARSPGFV